MMMMITGKLLKYEAKTPPAAYGGFPLKEGDMKKVGSIKYGPKKPPSLREVGHRR